MRRACASLLFLAVLHATAAAQDAGAIRFRFAFGALTGNAANPALSAITEDTKLRSGDRIKMMVEPQRPGFLYVIYRGPHDELDLMYPPDLKKTVPVGRKQYIPDGAAWLKLDDTKGNETFYVVGSIKRLNELEALLERHAAAPGPGKAALVDDIVAEIRRLRVQHRSVAAPVERPVLIGGNVRSLEPAGGPRELPDVAKIAVDITAGDFYARTFTVTHQ